MKNEFVAEITRLGEAVWSRGVTHAILSASGTAGGGAEGTGPPPQGEEGSRGEVRRAPGGEAALPLRCQEAGGPEQRICLPNLVYCLRVQQLEPTPRGSCAFVSKSHGWWVVHRLHPRSPIATTISQVFQAPLSQSELVLIETFVSASCRKSGNHARTHTHTNTHAHSRTPTHFHAYPQHTNLPTHPHNKHTHAHTFTHTHNTHTRTHTHAHTTNTTRTHLHAHP